MLLYFNFYLSNEEHTTESIKYDWIDALSFTGGLLDIVFIFIVIFFHTYNYKLNEIKLMHLFELDRASRLG